MGWTAYVADAGNLSIVGEWGQEASGSKQSHSFTPSREHAYSSWAQGLGL